MDIINIIIVSIFINNVVLAQFLGICPFLGVSGKISTSVGMTGAVVFVMAMANTVTYFIYNYLLLPLGIDFMKTITFILVIASLVQIVEIILKKVSPSLFQALGIYLPLITTNCAVLGIALLAINKNYNLINSVVYASATGVGFGLALIIMAGLREHLELVKIPEKVKGFPITLITASLLSMAFMGFSGLMKM